jgi:hypothetical protein
MMLRHHASKLASAKAGASLASSRTPKLPEILYQHDVTVVLLHERAQNPAAIRGNAEARMGMANWWLIKSQNLSDLSGSKAEKLNRRPRRPI